MKRYGYYVAAVCLSVLGQWACAGLSEGVDAHFSGDYPKAIAELKPLAEQGNAEAQTQYGLMFAWGHGVPKDDAVAVGWYRKAADQGESNGQYALCVMYLHGRGVPQNAEVAAQWCRQSAAQGNSNAQYELSLLYLAGQGVPKNKVVTYALQNLTGVTWKEVIQRNKIGKDGKSKADVKAAQSLVSAMRVPGKLLEAIDNYIAKHRGPVKAKH